MKINTDLTFYLLFFVASLIVVQLVVSLFLLANVQRSIAPYSNEVADTSTGYQLPYTTVTVEVLAEAFQKNVVRLLSFEGRDFIEERRGFFTLTSIMSHRHNMVAYAQVSECFLDMNRGLLEDPSNCDWSYDIFVKSTDTNEPAELIYSESKNTHNKASGVLFQPHIARAGGCGKGFKVPLTFSHSGKKMIAQRAYLLNCGSGASGKYDFFTIDLENEQQEFEPLATDGALFINNYETVIHLDGSTDSSRYFCGPAAVRNLSKVVVTDIDSGEVEVIKEDPEKWYELVSFQDGYLAVASFGVKDQDCYEKDHTQAPEIFQISI